MRQSYGYWGDCSVLFREICEVFEPDDATNEAPQHFVESACMLNAVCAGASRVIQFLHYTYPHFWSQYFTEKGDGMLSEICRFACAYQSLEAPIRGIGELLKVATRLDLEDNPDLRDSTLQAAVTAGHVRLQEMLQRALWPPAAAASSTGDGGE